MRRKNKRSDREQAGVPAPTVLGLLAAVGAFAATFGGPRQRFWQRMTFTGLGLGGFSLFSSREVRNSRVRLRDVPAGLAVAAGLYTVFMGGDRFARRLVPGGDNQIREIYALRRLRPHWEIATRLAAIVGPAEELFWRGLIQGGLARRFGEWPAAAIGSIAYAGVHLPSRNFTLIGAAGVAGLYWSVLRALRVPMGALIVSHIVWDIWIFLVQPTGETELDEELPSEPVVG